MGCAIAEALGYGKEAFLQAYNTNMLLQNIQAIEGSPVGELILKFMENRDEWEGTPSELLNELESLGEALRVNIKAKGFPKSANTVTRRLNELKSNLIEQGILFEIDRSSHQRTIKVRKISSQSSYRHDQHQQTSNNNDDINDDNNDGKKSNRHSESSFKNREREIKHDGNDDNDGIFRTSNGEADKICGICGNPLDGNSENSGQGLGLIHPSCKSKPIQIKALIDIPTFAGIDGISISLKANEIKNIPFVNAIALINRKVAVRIGGA